VYKKSPPAFILPQAGKNTPGSGRKIPAVFAAKSAWPTTNAKYPVATLL